MWWVVILSAALLIGCCAANAAPAEHDDGIDEVVNLEMHRSLAPGVAVATIRTGLTPRMRYYGYANVEHRVGLNAQTLFQSASLGKQLVAALVMLLKEDGDIDLEAPITTYLPDAPSSWRDIKVRHLLTHMSGLPNYNTKERGFDRRRNYSEDELLAHAYTLQREPGRCWLYSNTGYMLLGIIIHKISGRFYGDLLKERIFTPLGMNSARVISEADIIANRAAGYRKSRRGELKNQKWIAPKTNTTADGSLYLSLADWILWDEAVFRRALLKRESWTEIFTPVALGKGTYPYGFGWYVTKAGGRTVHFHDGGWQGFSAALLQYWEDDLTVIVLANVDDLDAMGLAWKIAREVDPMLETPEPFPDRCPARE